MGIDVSITLQTLDCNSTSGGASQSPYIWPVLLWVDDTTIQSGNNVDVLPPWLGEARIVIKSDMSAGQSAQIPYPLGTLSVNFEDNLTIRQLILAVALWEENGTPEAAVWAGFQAFASELRAALAFYLVQLQTSDDVERQLIITNIKMRVKDRVTAAISGALTFEQKISVFLRTLNLDSLIAGDFSVFPSPTDSSFSLNLTDASAKSYTIQGVIEARASSSDVCKAEVDNKNAAQERVNSITPQIEILQGELPNATPQEKPGIVDEIEQLSNELPNAIATLDAALQALQACRAHWHQVSQIKVTGSWRFV